MAGRVLSCIGRSMAGSLVALLASGVPCQAQGSDDGAQAGSPTDSDAGKALLPWDPEALRQSQEASRQRQEQEQHEGRYTTMEELIGSQIEFQRWQDRQRVEQETRNRVVQEQRTVQRLDRLLKALLTATAVTLFFSMRRYKKRAESAEAQNESAEGEIDLLKAQLRVLQDRLDTDCGPSSGQ